MTYQITCTLLSGIVSSAGAALLAATNKDIVIFENNIATNVHSKTYPGCISIKTCQIFNISRNSFSSCWGISENEVYANVLRCESAVITNFSDTSAYLCAPTTSECSDSVFYYKYCTPQIISCNTSCCYGTHGSSSFAIWWTEGITKITYLNNADGKEFCSLENYKCDVPTYLIKSNFINGSKNSRCILNTRSRTYYEGCVFVDNGNLPLVRVGAESAVDFANCYSSNTDHDFSSIIKTNIANKVSIFVKPPKRCKINMTMCYRISDLSYLRLNSVFA